MDVNPLLIPHMLNLSPAEIVSFRNGLPAKPLVTFMQKCRTEVVDGRLEPREVGSLTFADGNLSLHRHGYSRKMQENIIGSPIDVYGEIPLAHRTEITGFEPNFATFTCKDDYISFKDVPVHTDKSIKARRRRMAFEAFLHIKTHWMTRSLLNGLSIKQILAMDPRHFLIYDSGIVLDDKTLPEGDLLTSATLSAEGSAPSLGFGKGVSVESCAVSIPGRQPDAIANGLPGKPARKVIDHWLFEGSTINKVRLNLSNTRVTFASPGRTRSYAEDEPEKAAEIISRLRRSEARATPNSIKDWEKHLLSLDSERDCDPQDRMGLLHLYRNGEGKLRRGSVRAAGEAS